MTDKAKQKVTKAGAVELDESKLDNVTGGRVKTSDKQQEAVLKFVKG